MTPSLTMNVDKFGRHESILNRELLRGPKGEGFRLTHDGNYDMKNKRLCNIEDAIEESDSVNLKVLQSTALSCDSTRSVYDARSKRITNLAAAVSDNDAVNRQYVQYELDKLKSALEKTIKALPNQYTPSNTAATDGRSVDKSK